jgi:hypothetical protein
MKIDLADGELCLFADRPLRVSGASGLYVYCTSGTIWITTPNEPADIFLGSGQRHRIASKKLTLIESIGQARIRLEYPAPGGMVNSSPGYLASGLAGARRIACKILNRTSRAASERDFPASPSA